MPHGCLKQTSVGQINSEWELSPISSLAEIRGRVGWKGYTKRDLRSFGALALGAKHISVENRLDLSDPTYLSKEKYLESPEIFVEQADVLVVQRGSIGKVVLIDRAIGDATINPSMVLLRHRRIDPAYLFYQLTSQIGQSQIKLDTSSTGVPMITQFQIGSFLIPTPPTLSEQQRISAVLRDLDAQIDSLNAVLEKKRDLTHASMQCLLTGKIRLQGFSGSWKSKQLSEYGELKGGNGFPLTHQGASTGSFPFFKVSDMNNEGNSMFMFNSNNWISEETKRLLGVTLFPKNSIVFAKIGAAIFLERKRLLVTPSCIDNNLMAYVFKSADAHPLFFYYMFLNTALRDLISATALPSLNGRDIGALRFDFPSLPEQIAIASVLNDMDSDISALEDTVKKAKALKQGMMQELLTGRTRLK